MNKILCRRLVSLDLGAAVLLDAIEHAPEGGMRRVSVFFQRGADLNDIAPAPPWQMTDYGSVGGAPWMTIQSPDTATGAITIQIAGTPVTITPAAQELDILAGTNAMLSVRNGESADTVLAWIEYHGKFHGMNAAVILDRAKDGTAFADELERKLSASQATCKIVLINADVPLGAADLPPEAHPFCVPGAPGKDQMEVPPADPWQSPLESLLFYEIARIRFLGRARAVANIDVYDLLDHESDMSVFDSAVTANGGLVMISGRQVYPWRVRNDDPIGFADHICIQFDTGHTKQRWCIAPAAATPNAVWRLVRIGNATPDPQRRHFFNRFMALRHPVRELAKIVPKTSLIESESLIAFSQGHFGHNPIRMPEAEPEKIDTGRGRRAIITTMKNEGPFILEWVAYHRAIGFDDIIVYTNDCTDGTDTMLELLQEKGILQHRLNPFRETDLKPQHAALQAADDEPVIRNAKWVVCIDVDEYINIKVGNGTLDDLFAAVPDANMISMTWRLFGNSDVHEFSDGFITEQFTKCALEFANKPHQAWGFKTLFMNNGIFKKLGVHRPKGLNSALWDRIHWVNGSGKPLPKEQYRNAWRSTVETYGYDIVSLNHYAVRSAESFLVKRDRGRVNHVDRDQGLAYWFRMNNNAVTEETILKRIPLLRAEYDSLMSDPDIAQMHRHCVDMHRRKIQELRATPAQSSFYETLTGARLEKLSRLHSHFGSNVFLAGPDVIPDDVVARDQDEAFFFTVDKVETAH